MIATARRWSPPATPRRPAAAVEVLEAGGNAFDACVAAGFAAAVCEPALTSLGGGGFLLARTAAGEEVVFDFFVDTPGRGLTPSERRPHFDEVTVQFPAPSRASTAASARWPCRVPRRLAARPPAARATVAGDVVAPATRLADAGVEVSPSRRPCS